MRFDRAIDGVTRHSAFVCVCVSEYLGVRCAYDNFTQMKIFVFTISSKCGYDGGCVAFLCEFDRTLYASANVLHTVSHSTAALYIVKFTLNIWCVCFFCLFWICFFSEGVSHCVYSNSTRARTHNACASCDGWCLSPSLWLPYEMHTHR